MRARLNYKTLSKDVTTVLSEGAMELEHVKVLRKTVDDYATPVKKKFLLACILIVAMSAFMFGSSVMTLGVSNMEDAKILLSILGPVFVALVLGFAFIGWKSFGKIITQYNSGLKKGYPELYNELKL